MGNRTEQDELEVLGGEVSSYREQIHRIITQNQAIFEPFWDLLNLYNSAVQDMRTALHEANWEGKNLVVGPFSVSKQTKSGFDAKLIQEIAPDVLTQRGVVTAVNTKVLDSMLRAGRLSPDVAKEAFYERPATPRIVGPKIIKLNFE